MYSAISESSEFVHANLPRAVFELGSLGPQASLLSIEPPLLVIYIVSKVFNQVLTFFISFFSLAGISRSVTIAAAYITCTTSLNHQEALQVSSKKLDHL